MSPPALSEAKRRLLERYLRGEGAPGRSFSPAPARPARPAGLVPATAGQREIWMHEQLAGRPVYNECATIRRSGALDPEALARALTETVRRHESWRTGFSVVDGRLVQLVGAPFTATIGRDDLRGLPPDEREARAFALASADAARPFELTAPPLFRARLVRFDDADDRLFLTLHHLIFDTASLFGTFFPELVALYESFAAGEASRLPEPAGQFADYAAWEDARRLPPESIEFWRRRLAGLPPATVLPADRERSAALAGRGGVRRVAFPAALRDRVHRLAAECGATPFAVLFASIVALIRRHVEEDDLVLGCVSAARPRAEFERILGYFLNPVVLRTSTAGDPAFRELVGRVRDEILSALFHGDVPHERLAAALPDRGAPLFRILVSYEPPRAPVPSGWDLTLFDASNGNAKFDLSLEIENRANGIVGRFIYDTDLFDDDSIALLEKHWRALLESALSHPDRRVSDLDLWEDPGAQHAAIAPAPVMAPAPVEFARRAAELPSAEALRFGRETTRYGELAARVDGLARALGARGIGRESLVAIALPRSAERVAAILAVARAGAAWLPVGSDWPPARVSAVLADSRPALVIGDRTTPDGAVAAVALADLAAEGGQASVSPADPRAGDLAYVLYTSGSTGAPKGVMVEHLPLSNLLSWSQRAYPLGPGDRVLQKAPLEFDASVWEIFAPLVAGAALVVAPPGVERDPHALVRLLREERITHVKLVPSLLRMLLAVPELGAASELRHVFCGGEILPPELADDFSRRTGAQLHNLYGPTETCVDVAAHRCRPGAARRRVPMGRAIDNVRLVVLDRRGRRSPAGVAGELHVGGLALARGYLGREELTRERFVADPFGTPGGRLYRTGDRVRRRPDGDLEFLGRFDEQRKVRGVRVEPGELEAALRAQPEVLDAAVVVRGDERAPTLAAYVASPCAAGDAGLRRELSRSLRERLASILPRSFLPDTVTVVPALPLTASGKIDRGALPQPERGAPEGASAPESPEHRLLARIWSEVLGVEPVGIHDNLFDLGGNSLLVFQITTRAAQSGYAITPRQLFDHPTIAELAAAAGTLPATEPNVTLLTA